MGFEIAFIISGISRTLRFLSSPFSFSSCVFALASVVFRCWFIFDLPFSLLVENSDRYLRLSLDQEYYRLILEYVHCSLCYSAVDL